MENFVLVLLSMEVLCKFLFISRLQNYFFIVVLMLVHEMSVIFLLFFVLILGTEMCLKKYAATVFGGKKYLTYIIIDGEIH